MDLNPLVRILLHDAESTALSFVGCVCVFLREKHLKSAVRMGEKKHDLASWSY